MRKRFTRKELHQLVWSEPMNKLAKKFGISDVALAKHCRRLDVPRPPRGYWAKLAAGKSVTREYLPPRGPGMCNDLEVGASRQWWHRSYSEEEVLTMDPEAPLFEEPAPATAERLTSKLGRTSVRRTLSNPHHHIQRLLDDDEERRDRRSRSRFAVSWDTPLFDTAIERRRLRILNAIFVALTRIGVRPTIQGKEGVAAHVTVNDTTVSFELAAVSPTRSETRASDRSSKAGRWLRLMIKQDSVEEDARSEWCETTSGRLEGHVADIVKELITAAERKY
jgi:hypothetical protein